MNTDTEPIGWGVERNTYTLEQLCYAARLLKSSDGKVSRVLNVLCDTPDSPYGAVRHAALKDFIFHIELIERIVPFAKGHTNHITGHEDWDRAILAAYYRTSPARAYDNHPGTGTVGEMCG